MATGRFEDAAHLSFLRGDFLSKRIDSEDMLKELLRIRTSLANDVGLAESTNGCQCFASKGCQGWARKLWAKFVECLSTSSILKFQGAREKDANMFVSSVA